MFELVGLLVSAGELNIPRTGQSTALNPALAWDESLRSIFGMVPNESCLPPLVVSGVEEVENVPVAERQTLRRTVVILAGIVVKQSSGWRGKLTVSLSLQ
jgi:hypothetical protein